jgi:cytochrome P450 family 4
VTVQRGNSSTPPIAEHLFNVLRKWGRDHYPIYKDWILHVADVNVLNPEDFEVRLDQPCTFPNSSQTILSSNKHIAKGQVYDMLQGWLGTGLLTSKGSKWQHRRKILTPSFHFNILQDFIKIFHEETDRLVEVLKKECDKPFVDVTGYISDFTLNTIGGEVLRYHGTVLNLSCRNCNGDEPW